MRCRFRLFRLWWLAGALCILVAGAPILGAQQANDDVAGLVNDTAEPVPARDAATPPTELVFFSQHRMTDRAWDALFAALRASLPDAAAEIPALDARAELVRGDALPHGAPQPRAVVVYLHGDCIPSPLRESFSAGARLGWVVKVGSMIQPVIHVECTAIGEELSMKTERMDRDERTAAMSQGLARVILHEWAHIATQSGAHGAKGVTKARFGVDDLLANGLALTEHDAGSSGGGRR